MLLLVLTTIFVGTFQTCLATDQPTVPPPTEWRGVSFGKSLDDLMPTINERFQKATIGTKKDKKTLLKYPIITGKTNVREFSVDVEFEFHPETKELWEIEYTSLGKSGLALDAEDILTALTELYGKPTISLDTGPIVLTEWIWTSPSFRIYVVSGSLEGVDGVTVYYQWRDLSTYLIKKKKEAAKDAADEY